MTGRLIHAADLFCGAGGTSEGLVRACERMGFTLDLVAVNHWPRAVETHAANHPKARHYCARIDQVVLKEAFPGGKLDLLVASPECIFHSIARGGKPVDDQRRESAWGVLRWVDELRPRHVVIENVPEFRKWGPLGADNKPLKSKKGVIFDAWIQALRSYGYVVEWRVLNAADYGDPTTRRRLFVQARRGRRIPAWPLASHAEEPGGLFPASPWRAAREVIDWTWPSRSIFGRKRPLAPTTLERIAEGLRRFGGAAAEPFLLYLTHGGRVRSIDEPVPTVTCAKRGELGLAQPFVVKTAHKGGNGAYVRSVDDPLYAVTTAPGTEMGVVQPFFVEFHGKKAGEQPRICSVDDPLPTLTCEPRFAVAQPFLVSPCHGEGLARRTHSLDDPLPTQPATNAFAVVEPFLLSQDGRGAPRAVSKPSPTIVTDGAVSLVEPFVLPYYRTGTPTPVGEPLPTVTAKDRFGVVEPVHLDVLFRMLQPHELAAAMGFPKGYLFTGNRGDQVRQIGNAVCVSVADALCTAALGAA